MCFEYDGPNEFSNFKTVKAARKEHRCDECGGVVAVGESYLNATWKIDGDLGSAKVCRRCEYDRFRVAEHELAEGCRGSEIWCPIFGLVEYLAESGMGQTDPANVPAWYTIGDRPKEPAHAAN